MGGARQASSGTSPDDFKRDSCCRVAVKWHRLFQAYGTNYCGCLMKNRIEQVDATVFSVGRTQLLLTLCLVSLGLWMAVAKLAVPPVIESAYRGRSFPLLNRIIEGQTELPLEFYLQLWNRITTTVLLVGLSFFGLSWLVTS